MPSRSPNSNFLSLDQAIGDETLIDVQRYETSAGAATTQKPAGQRHDDFLKL